VVSQETLASLQQVECIPHLLAVVDELALVRAPEARHPKQALWVVGHQAIRFAKEHNGSVEELPIPNQPKPRE
jgi:hypothetical protein